MDETGHSKDTRQRFVGMAGLIAMSENWERFEQKWVKALKDYKIPFFHMKDFASFRGCFEGWSEIKRRKLLNKLLTIIDTTYALPIGSIIPMEDYKQLPQEHQGIFEDPYYLAFVECTMISAMLMQPMPKEERIAMVFAEQVEFRTHAMQMYEKARRLLKARERLTPPDFRDMRELMPLQAADLVAYECYKEYERLRYRPEAKPRYGFLELLRIGRRSANFHPIVFHTNKTLARIIRIAEGKEEPF